MQIVFRHFTGCGTGGAAHEGVEVAQAHSQITETVLILEDIHEVKGLFSGAQVDGEQATEPEFRMGHFFQDLMLGMGFQARVKDGNAHFLQTDRKGGTS